MPDNLTQTHTPPEGSFRPAEDAAPKPRNRHQRRKDDANTRGRTRGDRAPAPMPQGNHPRQLIDMATARRALGQPLPLLRRVPDACRDLGIGTTKAYEMMNSGELKSTVVGGRRLIYYASILQVAGLTDQDAE